MRVTMSDVAARAGVSVATVSHAINKTRHVSDEVLARVTEAIEATGYRRNDVARALKRSRTDSIGLVVADTGHPIFAEIVNGVDQAAQEAGQTLLLAHSHDDPAREREVVEALRERRVDGLLLVPAVGTGELVEQLARDELPTVVLDRLVDADLDQVGVETGPALRRLAAHLADVGHTRIAIVAGTLSLPINVDRVRDCTQELRRHGIPDDDIVVLSEDGPVGQYDPVDSAARLVREHLADPAPATALLTLNAHQTVGALQAVRDARLSIPDDLALVAMDDLPFGSLLSPGITCAAQPAIEMGRRALRLLLEHVEDGDALTETVLLPCSVVHRESCGCGGQVALREDSMRDTDPGNGEDGSRHG